MRGKATSQSKLIQLILAPLRILGRARDFYMKGMMDCAERVDYGSFVGGPSSQILSLPKGYGIKSSRPSNAVDQFNELLRAASRRRSEMESNMITKEEEVRQTAMWSNGMGRSYSVGVGKIGRIDEDKPCSFREYDNTKADQYGRSRSHAVMRNVVYSH